MGGNVIEQILQITANIRNLQATLLRIKIHMVKYRKFDLPGNVRRMFCENVKTCASKPYYRNDIDTSSLL